MDIKKSLEELATRFDALTEKKKEHEVAIAEINEEQLRMQGEYRALNALLPQDDVAQDEVKG